MPPRSGKKKSASKDEKEAAKTLLSVSVPNGERSNDDETEKQAQPNPIPTPGGSSSQTSSSRIKSETLAVRQVGNWGKVEYTGNEIVDDFMKLRRPPDSGRYHCVFGVCSNPIPQPGWPEPPYDILIATCTWHDWVDMCDMYPVHIFCHPTPEARTKHMVPYLLAAFNLKDKRQPNDHITVPKTWSTTHKELIKHLEANFTEIGLEPSLCKVDRATPQDERDLESSRAMWFAVNFDQDDITWTPETTKPGDSNHCHGCCFPRATFFIKLSKCPKCDLAWYHSEDCKAADWEMRHKYICGGLLHADLRACLRRLVFI